MIFRRFSHILAASMVIFPCFAGEISLPEYHISLKLPDGWQQVADPSPGILVRAQSNSGQLRFICTRPPIPMEPTPVQDAGFQDETKQALIDHGYSKIIRSEVIKVAGADAYLCEAAQEDNSKSIIQVVWFHEGHSISLVFLSLATPFKDVPDVQTIIDSVKVLPKL
jgi:hypothetical protein